MLHADDALQNAVMVEMEEMFMMAVFGYQKVSPSRHPIL
jgi:hypothetical protein